MDGGAEGAGGGGACRLLALPPEVLAHVASVARRRDLPALRLTCRALRAAAPPIEELKACSAPLARAF